MRQTKNESKSIFLGTEGVLICNLHVIKGRIFSGAVARSMSRRHLSGWPTTLPKVCGPLVEVAHLDRAVALPRGAIALLKILS